MYRVVSEREESSPEISQTEQTSHSRHEKMLAAQAHGNQGNMRMTGAVTTGEEDNDEFSDDGEDDLISSSLAETPAGEEDGTVTVSPLCTTGKQTSERDRRARVTQDGHQVQQDIRKVTE